MTDSESTTKIWELDTTHPEKAENLREGLRDVLDPELGLNIVELGLIRDVSMRDDEVHIEMILTTPYCPYGPALFEITRSKAQELMTLPAKIQMGTEYWQPSMMEDGTGADWGLY